MALQLLLFKNAKRLHRRMYLWKRVCLAIGIVFLKGNFMASRFLISIP